jgi:hypothetical protein
MGHKGPRIIDDSFGPPFLARDLAISHIVWGVTSQFANFVFYLWVLFSGPIIWYFEWPSLLPFACRFLVSCHNFMSYFFSFNNRSRPDISCYRSNIAVFLVDCLYAEAIETVKSRAFLSSSLEEWIWIFGTVSSKAKLWNRSRLSVLYPDLKLPSF